MRETLKEIIIVCCAFLVILVLVFNCVITVIDEWLPAQQQKWNKEQFEKNPIEYSQCVKCKRYFQNNDMWGSGICDECHKAEEFAKLEEKAMRWRDGVSPEVLKHIEGAERAKERERAYHMVFKRKETR